MAKLVYIETGIEREFQIDTGRAAYTIGRNPMCDLRINNPSMSRKHAELRLDAASGRFSIHDLGSSNGTFVNGTRGANFDLADGDRVVCGEFEMTFFDPNAPSASGSGDTEGGSRRSTFAGLPADSHGKAPKSDASEGTVGAVARHHTDGGRPGSGSVESPEPPISGTDDGDQATVSASMSSLPASSEVSSEPAGRSGAPNPAWDALDALDSNAGLISENARLREWLASAEEKIVRLQQELADAHALSGNRGGNPAEVERLRARNRALAKALDDLAGELERLGRTNRDLVAGLGVPD